jgi:hypothetical protein
MRGIGLGVVMEKYYKFNGRDVTGDELVSLVHCLTAEGQKAQTKCAQATDKLRDSKMECIKLEERLTESRRECFRLKNEVEQLHEQAAKHRLRIRFKTVYAAGIASYLAASLIMWNLDISEWSVDCRAACVMAALSIAVLVETIEYFKDDR